MAVYQRRENKLIQVPTLHIAHRGYRVISTPYVPDTLPISNSATSPNFSVRAYSILEPPQELTYSVSIPSLGIGPLESSDGDFTIPLDSSTPDSTVDCVILVKDVLGNVSHTVKKPIRVARAIVQTPTVVVPTDKATVRQTSELTVTIGNNFMSLGSINDVYLATDYRICTDIAGYYTMTKFLGATIDNKYSFTFKNQVFNDGMTYYVFARFVGKQLGYSSWSLPVSFTYSRA